MIKKASERRLWYKQSDVKYFRKTIDLKIFMVPTEHFSRYNSKGTKF